MWKWLGGCLVLAVLLIIGAMLWSYRTIKESLSPDGSASVMIGAAPGRVFASLGNGDSAATWMAEGGTVLTSRHGQLVAGDTLRIEARTRMPIGQQAITWRVRQIVPGQLLVLDLLEARRGGVIFTRRDSIAPAGDSTSVTTKILSPMLDSLRTVHSKTKGKSDDGALGVGSGMMLSLFMMEAKMELERLKARIERVPAKSR